MHLGIGRFILVNLFSWRVIRPRDLRAAATAGNGIIGSDTDQVIADAARRAAVVAASGHHGTLLGRERQVIDPIADLMCIGLTAKGHLGTRCTSQPPNHSSHCTDPAHPGGGRSDDVGLGSVDTERSARADIERSDARQREEFPRTVGSSAGAHPPARSGTRHLHLCQA